ncbi:Uncharacterised protein g738 [Pycnogonum litorale]
MTERLLLKESFRVINIDSDRYISKCVWNHDSYSIIISDFKNIWFECMFAESICNRNAILNPYIEASVSRIIQLLKNCFDDAACLNITRSTDVEDGKILSAHSKVANIPFKWEFVLSIGPADMVLEHLTSPLLAMISELNRRQLELQKLLSQKDAEIQDYIFSGASVSNNYLETVPFNEDVLFNHDKVLKDMKTANQDTIQVVFSDRLQILYKDVMKHKLSVSADDNENDAAETAQKVVKSESIADDKTVEETELKKRKLLEEKLTKDSDKRLVKRKQKIKYSL